MYKFVNLISTLVICLKFVFIEMLDKLITYINVFVQDFVSGLACCVNKPQHNSSRKRLVVILVHTTGSTWYKVLYHYTMYVMGIYCGVFSSPCQRQCELLPSLGIRRLSSVNFSHFNLLFWNPSAKWTETW